MCATVTAVTVVRLCSIYWGRGGVAIHSSAYYRVKGIKYMQSTANSWTTAQPTVIAPKISIVKVETVQNSWSMFWHIVVVLTRESTRVTSPWVTQEVVRKYSGISQTYNQWIQHVPQWRKKPRMRKMKTKKTRYTALCSIWEYLQCQLLVE